MAEVIPLYDDVYAVRFPYPIVTWHTMGMAIPSSFRREVARKHEEIRFAEESPEEAGTKRADCEQIRRCFPAEVAILESQVDDLSQYVIFKLKES